MKKSQKKAVAVGAGLAALAATAAGVYFMTGKNAKNRKKVAAWAGKMQKDVVKELRKVEKASRANYHKVVDAVAKNYKGMKNVSTAELAAAAAELKSHWSTIQDDLKSAAKTVRRVVPKAAKSAARKVSVKKAGAAKSAAPKRKTASRK